MIELARDTGVAARRRHVWPHGARVLDLGDDVEAAAQLRDFAAHDYELRGVPLSRAGLADVVAYEVVAYYDGQHQSRLTSGQLDLVHAWIAGESATRSGSPPVERRTGSERTIWLALAALPAILALAFVAYAVGAGGTSVRAGGPVLVSAGGVLSLVSALATWRGTHGADARTSTGVTRTDGSD